MTWLGRGYDGIATHGGGYIAPPVKYEAEISANHSVRNRNGGVPSMSQPFVAMEDKMSSNVVMNVDRDNSNYVRVMETFSSDNTQSSISSLQI